MKGEEGDRFTLTSNMNFKILNWATLTTGLRATLFNIKNNALGLSMIQASGGLILLPYNQFVDENGNRVDYYKTYNEDFLMEIEAFGY